MIISELLDTLYSNVSPYNEYDFWYVDRGYPHTNIKKELLTALFKTVEPSYILECGSMCGGSAIIMAETLQECDIDSEIVCVDPFTGDVNMWDWEKNDSENNNWRFLRLENGMPTIYKRFLANCKISGFESKILPVPVTTSVGTKLIRRLHDQNRISSLPNYIYLDSAHEPDETLLELKMCWELLEPGGILFGDDWNWESVRNDVLRFSELIKDSSNNDRLNSIVLEDSLPINGNILFYENQWVLFK